MPNVTLTLSQKSQSGWCDDLGSYGCFWPCVALRFACQVQNRAQQNVAKHCACGGEACVDTCVDTCVDMRLRVCRDIQPGSELLLYEDSDGEGRAAKEGKERKGQEGNYLENS